MTSLTFHSELSINQLHFISHILALWSFYWNFELTTRRCFQHIWLLGSLQNAIFVAVCACSEPHVPHTSIGMRTPCCSYGHRCAHRHCTISMTACSPALALIEEYRYSILSHGSPEYSLLYLRSAIDKCCHCFSVTSLAWTTELRWPHPSLSIPLPCIVPMHNTFSCEKNHAE